MARVKVRQFAGDVRLWEIAPNGTRIPVIPEPNDPDGNQPIEANSLIFGYEAGEDINVVSRRRGARFNQPVHKDTLPGSTDVTMGVLELPPLLLARILFGEGSTSIVAAGTVTDAAFEATKIGVPLQLPHRLLTDTAEVIKKGADTLVAGTDYRIDRRRGQIIFLEGGEVEEGDALTRSYAYGAQVSTTIIGGATPTKSFYLTGDMEDRINGGDGELTVPEVRLTVDGDVDWLSLEPIEATFTGTAVIADGESAPYTFVFYEESE